MIIEALTYLKEILFTSRPKWAQEMGYLYESIGIEARYNRCKAAWTPHLEQSKTAILEAASKCELTRTAIVVGSGPGYDLPLEELYQRFSRIILIDAVHPACIVKRAKKLMGKTGKGRIILLSADITETAENQLANPAKIQPVPTPTLYHGFMDIDLVVSLNIASQLSVSPLQWLSKRQLGSDEELNAYACDLAKAHLDWLKGFQCTKLLICDRQWTRKESFQGRVLERIDPFSGVDMPQPDKIWTWQICPIEEMPDVADRKAGVYRENVVGSHLITY